jgi:hypothetical protein
LICPGNTYTYEVSGNAPYTVEWQATGGFPASQTGDPVAVTWNAAGPYSLTARHVSIDGLGCASAPVTYNINVPSSLVITGTPAICENGVGTYATSQIEGLAFQWEIVPSSAGTVSSGQGTNAVEIFWDQPGNHQVRVTACGYNAQQQVVVNANPEPAIDGPTGLCAGISASYSSVQSYVSYEWMTADGGLLSSTATADLVSGSYVLEVVDNNGCTGATDFSVADLPPPNVSVTTANPTGFCNNGAFVTMTALVPRRVPLLISGCRMVCQQGEQVLHILPISTACLRSWPPMKPDAVQRHRDCSCITTVMAAAAVMAADHSAELLPVTQAISKLSLTPPNAVIPSLSASA